MNQTCARPYRPSDDTDRHDIKGCQDLRRTAVRQDVLLAYSLFFKQKAAHCILAYSIHRSVSVCVCVCIYMRACVRVFVCVYVCSSVSTPHWWSARKRFEINSPIFSSCRPLKRHPMTYLATFPVMILIYFLKIINSNTDLLDRLNLIVCKR